MLDNRNTVSAKRDVYILSKPASQRDVPSSPELGDTLRNIRIIKVLSKFKSKHLSQADCHIRITAEVKINLESIGNTSNPGA